MRERKERNRGGAIGRKSIVCSKTSVPRLHKMSNNRNGKRMETVQLHSTKARTRAREWERERAAPPCLEQGEKKTNVSEYEEIVKR